MINLYRLALPPAFLLAAPYYAWRMLRRGGYSRDFSHRWGGHKKLPPKPAGRKRIWIQAVSVGEVEAMAALVEKLSALDGVDLILTTTTSTGYEILRKKYSDKALLTGVFPFDFYPFSRRAWNNFDPDLAVLMEGELWPEHLHQAKIRGVPVALVNARMSDRSFGRYAKFPSIARKILGGVSLIAASSQPDMERFIKLGADVKKIFCAGNMKFDAPKPTAAGESEKSALKKEFGFAEDSLVLLGSSTWPGEEEMLVEALKEIRASRIDCRLLLVPRHAERRAEAVEAIKSVPHHVRSRSKQAPQGTLAYLADTTGELRELTRAADLAFIGKSLPPNRGGQSPLECAAAGVPMVYGPRMSNFRQICKTLEDSRAAIRTENSRQAQAELLRLAQSPELRAQMGKSAKEWHTSNIGASERCFQALKKLLES